MDKKQLASRRALKRLRSLLRDFPLGSRQDDDWDDCEFYSELWDTVALDDMSTDASLPAEDFDALELN